MSLLSRRFSYSKLEMEDPEEVRRRRAQFLIYKTLQRADSPRRRPSWLKVKTSKLKIRIGKRLKRLRKSILSTISNAEAGLHKQLISHLKAFKCLLRSEEASILPCN
ncbi:uncharacterized protein LOC113783848 [Coffea eugenioides]|uniref:Uncharacterized protein n=1 Tax=Coffea arabica TaxID=13443 RepID=A0A6P6UBM3_COFAR|nr:uncharacterized protein LOC113709312 [Coffea arabica]XP_027185888.1 uncharacterized protein LOC113783848 [Coffea eugenioides]